MSLYEAEAKKQLVKVPMPSARFIGATTSFMIEAPSNEIYTFMPSTEENPKWIGVPHLVDLKYFVKEKSNVMRFGIQWQNIKQMRLHEFSDSLEKGVEFLIKELNLEVPPNPDKEGKPPEEVKPTEA